MAEFVIFYSVWMEMKASEESSALIYVIMQYWTKMVDVLYYQGGRVSINSSHPSAAYMRPRVGSTLFQLMACRLSGAKPLSKPMLGYCKLAH